MNLYIGFDQFLKWSSLVQATDKEVLWYHYARPVVLTDSLGVKNLHFKIESEMHLPVQEVTGTTVSVTAEDNAQCFWDLEAEQEDYYANCWCHSHVNMGVFASETDKKDQTLCLDNNTYMLMVIVNKRDEFFGEYWFKDEFGVIWKQPLVLVKLKSSSYDEEAQEKVKKYLKARVYTVPLLPAKEEKAETARGTEKETDNTQAYDFWACFVKPIKKDDETYLTWCNQGKGGRFKVCEWIPVKEYNSINARIAQIIQHRKRAHQTVGLTIKEIESELLDMWIDTEKGIIENSKLLLDKVKMQFR